LIHFRKRVVIHDEYLAGSILDPGQAKAPHLTQYLQSKKTSASKIIKKMITKYDVKIQFEPVQPLVESNHDYKEVNMRQFAFLFFELIFFCVIASKESSQACET
jgi:hypothetical protein